MVSKWREVLEIGRKAAHDHGGHDETRAPEWQRRGRVGKGKGHYENYDGSIAVSELAHQGKATLEYTQKVFMYSETALAGRAIRASALLPFVNMV
jgi:hypothetical protein